jgi:hypothetical protein
LLDLARAFTLALLDDRLCGPPCDLKPGNVRLTRRESEWED